MVLVADPQLVDPHTYPGRPWPLSALTERYTDLYMGRNFRGLNAMLDPDSVVFLGDLFDGGREWEPAKARELKPWQVEAMRHWRVEEGATDGGKVGEADGKVVGEKRSLDGGSAAGGNEAGHEVKQKAPGKEEIGKDPRTFVPGENGRWQKWGQKQWEKEYRRFVRIFFDDRQLYPNADRRLLADHLEVPPDSAEGNNGASQNPSYQYATTGGKQRRLITSLPGNHDLGFGERVQLSVRNRFQSRFGEGNRVDVLGNHTLVSIDTPSMSAQKQYVMFGETSEERAQQLTHIWGPTAEFLNNLTTTVATSNIAALRNLYPQSGQKAHLTHDVVPLKDAQQPESKRDPSTSQARLPIIFLTHVPLYRDPDTDCGRLRERGNAIPFAAGYQYQNVLTKDLTKSLVGRISSAGKIAHVFSGDDHDYCELNHRYNVDVAGSRSTVLRNVREITVKSFSWAMGVRRPGFQLVSLWNPVGPDGETVGVPLPTIQSHLCLLPDQLSIFIDYALLLGITLAVLIVRAIWVGIRAEDPSDSDSDDDLPMLSKLSLPRFLSRSKASANGFSALTRHSSQKKGRQRAASTSTSTNGATQLNPNNLSVQRSHTARTRSVSPNPYAPPPPPGPLIEQAGYYPQVRWTDPDEMSEDEESNLGTLDEDDSQAKWRRRPRKTGKTKGPVNRKTRSNTFSQRTVDEDSSPTNKLLGLAAMSHRPHDVPSAFLATIIVAPTPQSSELSKRPNQMAVSEVRSTVLSQSGAASRSTYGAALVVVV
nr:uncharacterized protein CFP56_73906 [Quercus suber]